MIPYSPARPNRRRARVLALEIEALTNTLWEARSDPAVTAEQIEDLTEELNHLRHELFLTGVTSEYDL